MAVIWQYTDATFVEWEHDKETLNDPTRRTFSWKEKDLKFTQWGMQGWECYAVIRTTYGERFYFKRSYNEGSN